VIVRHSGNHNRWSRPEFLAFLSSASGLVNRAGTSPSWSLIGSGASMVTYGFQHCKSGGVVVDFSGLEASSSAGLTTTSLLHSKMAMLTPYMEAATMILRSSINHRRHECMQSTPSVFFSRQFHSHLPPQNGCDSE